MQERTFEGSFGAVRGFVWARPWMLMGADLPTPGVDTLSYRGSHGWPTTAAAWISLFYFPVFSLAFSFYVLSDIFIYFIFKIYERYLENMNIFIQLRTGLISVNILYIRNIFINL